MKNETIKTFDFNIDVSVYQNEFDNLDWNYLNKLQEKMILKSSGLFKDMAHLPVGFDKAIVLKFLNKETNLYNMFYDEEFFKPILDYFGDQSKISNIFFNLLEKNTKILPHIDPIIGKLYRRIHIPIVTNDKVLFINAGHVVNMKEGRAYEIDNSKTHAVNNASDKDRIHLVIDYYE